MSSTYSGSNTYHGSIVIPSDGDPAIAESVNVALRALQDSSVNHQTNIAKCINAVDAGTRTYTLLGTVILNGPGTFDIGTTEVQIGGGAFSTNHAVINATEIDLAGITTNVTTSATNLTSATTSVGSGAAQHFNIYATMDVYGPASWHTDVVFGHNVDAATLTVTGDADLQGTTQLATVSVSGALTVDGETTLNDTTRIRASTHIGGASTDGHLFTGDVEFQNDVTMDAGLTVEGAIVSNASSGNSFGDTTIGGALSVLGNTTIGNSSSDSWTLNALLASPMGFLDAGRVLRRPTVLSGDTAITPVSGDTVIVRGTQTVTMDNTTASDGDWFMILSIASAATIQYPSYDGSTRSMSMGLNQAAFFVYLDFYGGWLGGKWSFTPGV